MVGGRGLAVAHNLRVQSTTARKTWWQDAACSHWGRSGSREMNTGAQLAVSFFLFNSAWTPSKGWCWPHPGWVSFLKEQVMSQGISLSDSKSSQVGNKESLSQVVMKTCCHVHPCTHSLGNHIYTFQVSAAVARSEIAAVHSSFQLWETLPTFSSPKLCSLTFPQHRMRAPGAKCLPSSFSHSGDRATEPHCGHLFYLGEESCDHFWTAGYHVL